MSSNEKINLINEIKGLMNPIPQRRYNYDSLTTHKIVDKLFMRLGIVLIIGLLIYVAVKVGTQENNKKRF